jgi:hypothetical protein
MPGQVACGRRTVVCEPVTGAVPARYLFLARVVWPRASASCRRTGIARSTSFVGVGASVASPSILPGFRDLPARIDTDSAISVTGADLKHLDVLLCEP